MSAPAVQVTDKTFPKDRISSVPQRLTAIDAARGFVMLFSCVAHFAWWIHGVYPNASETLAAIGMIASPSFLLISGSMIGLLAASSLQADRLKQQFFNRGLFLLTVGHVLIALAETHDRIDFIHKLEGSTIIDEIGLATLLASCFINKIRDVRWAHRAALVGAIVFAVSWMLNLLWFPQSPTLGALKQIFIGGDLMGSRFEIYTAPTLQYVAIYSLGLPIGHALAREMTSPEGRRQAARVAFVIGLSLSASSAFLHAAWPIITAHSHTPFAAAIQATLRITAKHPPSPAYLMFYAGCGFMITGTLIGIWERGWAWSAGLIRRLATLGRASFFIFVLQYFLYWTLPVWLHMNVTAWCPLIFIGNVVLMYYAARTWLRHDGNRWMTFGIVLPNHSAVGKR